MEEKPSDPFLGQAINGAMIAPVSFSWNKVVRSFLKLIIADFKTVVLSCVGRSVHHCSKATVFISGRSANGVGWRFFTTYDHKSAYNCSLRFVKKPSWQLSLPINLSLLEPFDKIFVSVDLPANALWQTLCDEFPEAKVVLVVRDEDRWIKSLLNHIDVSHFPNSNYELTIA